MATIRPFLAWHYNHFLTERLTELTAPLSETMHDQRQAIFYREPYHYYHIASPIDTPPYHNARRRVENWKLDKVILPQTVPAIYVYRQTFRWKEDDLTHTRLGFIALVKAENYSQKIILPHENTIEKAVTHRTHLLEETQMQTIPTHGFYTDKDCILEKYLLQSIGQPISQVEDKNGNLHEISRLENPETIAEIIKVMQNRQIWIADGHHRYESSVRYREEQLARNPQATGEEIFNYHLMWLTNTESSDLGILPTHRLVHSLPNFSESEFLNRLSNYFTWQENETEADLGIAPCENLWTFLLVLPQHTYRICLKPEAYSQFDSSLPEVIKGLDLSILHHFILEKTLGIAGQKQFEYLDFTQYYHHCYSEVASGKAQFAIITRRITLPEIEKVIQNGYTMPAKTTYFFPKVLGGLVFSEA
ncbi:MAG: DUF1015 domain-containing protein [Microscillaceae bacterium]|jgi:uncharacterized protein (DUF1015 family)|nr:DUF1015 domain-containing protein [Microscillaceae bacterium]